MYQNKCQNSSIVKNLLNSDLSMNIIFVTYTYTYGFDENHAVHTPQDDAHKFIQSEYR